MYMHPHLSSLIGHERQREMMAHARRQRLGRQVSDLARASRGGDGTGRRCIPQSSSSSTPGRSSRTSR